MCCVPGAHSGKRKDKKPIRNYDEFRRMCENGTFTTSRGTFMTALQIDRRYDIGWLQLLAWMARYNEEKTQNA